MGDKSSREERHLQLRQPASIRCLTGKKSTAPISEAAAYAKFCKLLFVIACNSPPLKSQAKATASVRRLPIGLRVVSRPCGVCIGQKVVSVCKKDIIANLHLFYHKPDFARDNASQLLFREFTGNNTLHTAGLQSTIKGRVIAIRSVRVRKSP